MIKNKDIVVISIQPWDIEIGSNCKNIARKFAKNNRVLYVNPPLDRVTSIKQRKLEKIEKRKLISKGKQDDLIQLDENLWNLYPKSMAESINWISSHSIFELLNKRNARRFANDISDAIDRLGFKDYILFNDSSMFYGLHLNSMLEPKINAYYMRDFLIKVPYWKRHGEIAEPKVMKEADVILNNSTFYAEYGSQYNEQSIMVGQGCDLEMFNDDNDELIIPADLSPIQGPVIGYVGSLTTLRLDLELLETLATERPDWSVVLVGPEDADFSRSKLHNMSNVYFLGNKDSGELPNYIKGFDVTINPQVVNEITIGNYPRKIDEYLAMGKPVVATYTKAMEMFADYVYLAKSPEDYVELIEKALADSSTEKSDSRKTFARSHTWDNNVEAIYNAIESLPKYNRVWN